MILSRSNDMLFGKNQQKTTNWEGRKRYVHHRSMKNFSEIYVFYDIAPIVYCTSLNIIQGTP